MTAFQIDSQNMLPFRWVPWFIDFRSDLSLYGWIVLGGYSISFNCDLAEDEVLIAQFKSFTFCRVETKEEELERLNSEPSDEELREYYNRSANWYY